MLNKKQIRHKFKTEVFARDGYACKCCGNKNAMLDSHHITNRKQMIGGGYVKENGISVCPECHIKAEAFHSGKHVEAGYSPEELYKLINSSYELAVEKSRELK